MLEIVILLSKDNTSLGIAYTYMLIHDNIFDLLFHLEFQQFDKLRSHHMLIQFDFTFAYAYALWSIAEELCISNMMYRTIVNKSLISFNLSIVNAAFTSTPL